MKEEADLIICGDYVLTMNAAFEVITYGAVAISNGKICEVGRYQDIAAKYSAVRTISGTNRAILPGFVNAHTHSAMAYFRGMAEGALLKGWLEKYIWPAEARWLTPEFVSDATELACLEMLKAGITAFSDMYFYGDSTAEVVERMGMRAMLGAGIIDFPTAVAKDLTGYLANAERFINKWQDSKKIVPSVAPHAVHTCGPETLVRSKELAAKYGVAIHLHLSETAWESDLIKTKYGMTPVEHLHSLGLLDSDLVAAHCVHVTEEEISVLAERRVTVAHCIESNLKLASGIAPVPAMIRAGLNVALGTDGAASNNDLNIMAEMSTAAKVHKAVSGDPAAVDAQTALLLATRNGAAATGMAGKAGILAAGMSADIISVNLRAPHMTPVHDICSQLVYSAMASDVKTVVIDGSVIIDEGRHVTADEEMILDRAVAWRKKING